MFLTPERIINIIVHLLAIPLTPERIINLIVHLLAIPLTPERIINLIVLFPGYSSYTGAYY
jgi:hypothetical protein